MGAEIPICSLCHTENAEEEGGHVVLGLPELSNVYSTYHDDSSGATESQDAATEAAGSSSQRQDPGEGMSPSVGQSLGKWYGKGKYVPAVWSHHQRQGRNHRNQQPHSGNRCPTRRSAIPARRWKDDQNWIWYRTTKPRGCWKRPMWRSKQPRTKRSKQHSGWDRQWRRWHRSGNCWGGLVGGIKRTRTMWEKLYEAVNEEERLQNSKGITVQCIDFCEATTAKVHAVFRLAPADSRGGTLLQHPLCSGGNCGIPRKPTSLPTDPPCSQVPGLSRRIHIAAGISCLGESRGTGAS